MSQAIVELLKMSLSLYFSIAKIHNANEDELDAIYREEKGKFLENTPDKLEDV